jgi:DNA polymerase-3 subunit epsilon
MIANALQEIPPEQRTVKETVFVIFDFETVTPRGRPAEPLELAAMRIVPALSIDQDSARSWLIRPPREAPLTPFDTQQTGICLQDIQDAPDAPSVLCAFDACFADAFPALVAHNAKYDAAILQRFASSCPRAATLLCIDTLTLGRRLLPGLPSYKLDTLASHFSLPIPKQRHRALPDVRLTAQIFLRLIHLQLTHCPEMTLGDLHQLAGISRKEEQQCQSTKQMSLFE